MRSQSKKGKFLDLSKFKLIVVCLLRKKVMVKYKGIKGQDEILNYVVCSNDFSDPVPSLT